MVARTSPPQYRAMLERGFFFAEESHFVPDTTTRVLLLKSRLGSGGAASRRILVTIHALARVWPLFTTFVPARTMVTRFFGGGKGHHCCLTKNREALGNALTFDECVAG